MQQLPPSAYMPHQWPIPPLWNTSGNWYNNVVPQVPLPEWHAYVNDMWRTQNMLQPQSQRPMTTAIPASNHTRPVGGPKPIAKTIMAACGSTSDLESPSPVRHQSEIVAAPVRMPLAPTVTASPGDAGRTSLAAAQPRLLQMDSSAKPEPAANAATVPDPEIAAAAAPGLSGPNNKRAAAALSLAAGPSRPRGKGNTCVTRGEQCAVDALAQIFPGKEFFKMQPDWLIHDRTSRALEIDLYCHELRLGVEHSGLAHYCFPNSLHKTREEFDAQVYRDQLKRTLCARAGVLLIEIPFTVRHVSMQTYIRSEIDRLSDEHDK